MDSIRFSAMKLNFPRGKNQVTRDNTTGKTVMFSDWEVVYSMVPPHRASLLNDKGEQVAEYPVRTQVRAGGQLDYIIDELDLEGAAG